MLDRSKTAVVAIDFQDRLLPAMNSEEQVISETIKLIKGVEMLGVPHVFTQQYTKGLGETNSEIKGAVSGEFSHVEKTSFSAYGTPEFVEKIERLDRRQIVLCGVETHVCVMQTALDLLEAGYEVYLVTDCVSSRKESDEIISLERMKEAGAIITTSETVLFEMLRGAKEEGFKEISNLVK